VTRETTISVRATDNVAVQRVIFWITGQLTVGSASSPRDMANSGGGNFSAIYNADSGNIDHVIHVIAIDTAGNRSAEVTISAR